MESLANSLLVHDEREKLIEDLRQHQFELQQQNEELRRTYGALQQATIRFRDLWNTAPVGYVSHDRIGVITSANERARTLFGNIVPLIEGASIQPFFDSHSQHVFKQHLWAVANSEELVVAELRLETIPDEPDIWIRIESTAVELEIRTAIVDISRQKAAEAERLVLANQLRHSQKMEVLHELSAGIAHDFNNVLQVVLGYSELIRGQLESDGEDLQAVDSLIAGAGRGTDLTKRLLAFSRKSTLLPRPTDIGQLVDNVVSLAGRTVGDDILISAVQAERPVLADVDASLIEQAVLNLCLNSRDAMPEGGKLLLSTEIVRLDGDRPVNGCEVNAGHYARITVLDNGVGMSETIRERVFEPFFTTKNAASGTGLGLSIVYGIIRQHAGAISVNSAPGRGAEFQVFLPMSEAEAEVPVSIPIRRLNQQGGGSILLAEDESAIREVLAQTLQSAGYDVHVAVDGVGAIELINDSRLQFDLLLTDVVMPRASGKQVCAAFRNCYRNAPVIFLTGHGDSVINRDFLVDHNADLLTKPIRQSELLQAIQDKMGSRCNKSEIAS